MKSYTQSDMAASDTYNNNSAIGLIDQAEDTFFPGDFIAQINKSGDPLDYAKKPKSKKKGKN